MGEAMYRNILIATEGSALGDKCVSTGVALAKHLGATITVVHVTEPWATDPWAHKRALLGRIQRALPAPPRFWTLQRGWRATLALGAPSATYPTATQQTAFSKPPMRAAVT